MNPNLARSSLIRPSASEKPEGDPQPHLPIPHSKASTTPGGHTHHGKYRPCIRTLLMDVSGEQTPQESLSQGSPPYALGNEEEIIC